jgi:hypothetical protein
MGELTVKELSSNLQRAIEVRVRREQAHHATTANTVGGETFHQANAAAASSLYLLDDN